MALKGAFMCFVRNFRSAKFNLLTKTFNVDARCIRECSVSKVMVLLDPEKAYLTRLEGNTSFSFSVFVTHAKLSFSKRVTVVRPVTDTVRFVLNKFESKLMSLLEKRAAKKQIEFSKEDKPSNIGLIHDGEPLPDDMISSVMFELNGEINLILYDKKYTVAVNVPTVLMVKLPNIITPHIEVFPVEFKTQNALLDRTTFKWYRSNESDVQKHITNLSWTEVGENFTYLVTDSDIGHYLKLSITPGNEKNVGPQYFIVSNLPVMDMQQNPYFVLRHKYTKERTDDDKIRIVNYNVLSDIYANTKEGKLLFLHCPVHALKYDYRIQLLASELVNYNADVICLQEVDGQTYSNFLSTLLGARGFEGNFCPKSTKTEGTAVFYNNKKFLWMYSSNFRYSDEITTNSQFENILQYIKNESSLFEKLISLPHCFQLVVLDCLTKENEALVVANLHLYSAPEAWKIRLLQVYIAMSIAFNFKFQNTQKNISFVMCGDLNSQPSEVLLEFIENGKCTNITQTSKEMSDEESLWIGRLEHSYKMKSVFDTDIFTNYTPMFKGCIDYIFYQSDKMEVSKIFPLPGKEDLEKYEGLPSEHHPSDHIALVADLQWRS